MEKQLQTKEARRAPALAALRERTRAAKVAPPARLQKSPLLRELLARG